MNTLNPFLSVPKSFYTDPFENARCTLTWQINLFLVIILCTLTLVFCFVQPDFIFHYACGAALTLGSIYYMIRFGKYKIVPFALCFLAYLLVTSSMLLVTAPHYIEPFWILGITMYIFFVLGRRLGIVFLILNSIAMAIYFIWFANTNWQAIEQIPFAQSITMTVKYCASMVVIGYIVQSFIVLNRNAEVLIKKANNKVTIEKQNVEKRNNEKTILLQEIHHRVKNNLQVITSLLRMQKNTIKSEEAKIHFEDSINRIMTMALIHQKMYEKDDFSQINMLDYLTSHTKYLLIAGRKDNTISCEVFKKMTMV